jgi:hypothetical protein
MIKFYEWPIFGKGLTVHEVETIQTYLKTREPLKKKEWMDWKGFKFPENLAQRSIEKKLFGLWLMIGHYMKEAPILFVICFPLGIYEVIKSVIDTVRFFFF